MSDQPLVTTTELLAALSIDAGGHYPAELVERVCTAAEHTLLPYLAERNGGYHDVPEVREAALTIAVELWQHRVAPGGVTQAADFTPGPFRLGRSLLSRVHGMLGSHLDTGSMVG